MIILRRTPSWKPPCGANIAWGHPLSYGLIGCWLFNDGAGVPSNIARPGSQSWAVAPQSYSVGKDGMGMRLVGGTSGGVITNISDQLLDFTVVARCETFGTASNYERIVDKSYTTANVIFRWSGDPGHYSFGVAQTTGFLDILGVSDNVPHQIVQIRKGTQHTAYVDGGRLSATGVVTGAALSATPLYIGTNAGTESLNGMIYSVLMYNRALSLDEVKAIYVEPYSFLSPQRNNLYVWGQGVSSMFRRTLSSLGTRSGSRQVVG